MIFVSETPSKLKWSPSSARREQTDLPSPVTLTGIATRTKANDAPVERSETTGVMRLPVSMSLDEVLSVEEIRVMKSGASSAVFSAVKMPVAST